MEKVDKVIESLCDWVQKELDTTGSVEINDVYTMTCALAELVSARAKHN